MNTMHLEDFVALGRTVPEVSKKYGKRVCMADYSPMNNQFLRVYPLMLPVKGNSDANGFKSRHTYAVDLQRNPEDNRSESWRVVDELHPTTTPWDAAPEVSTNSVIKWLEPRAVPTIRALDECRLSIGVMLVKAGSWQGLSQPRDQVDTQPEHRSLFDDLADQVGLSGTPEFDPTRVKFAPYIVFSDAGGNHKLQLREWGAFMLLGNPTYADDPDALWNANGYKKDMDTFLVLGNMAKHRKNWLVIKTFQRKPATTNSLFDDADDQDE